MKEKKATTIFLVILFLIGLSLLLYPTVSDRWNSHHQSKAIAAYTEEVAAMDEQRYREIWESARAYNRAISERGNVYLLSEEEKQSYQSLLNTSGTGIMSYIEIPALDVTIPIYHGTDDGVLQVAVGHLDWTSLPVGGESTHCVVSGHRGLPSAELFTHLDHLVEGDLFTLRTLNEVLTYQVDQILIVLPHETDALQIEPGKDLCTLVTCTPYGVNTHRLLVRGHRVENIDAHSAVVTADARQIEPLLVAPVLAAPLLLLLLLLLLLPGGGHRKRRNNEAALWNDCDFTSEQKIENIR